ncbi:MAG: hypothetical protein K2J36_10805 [Ruminococcus sp.]|nr:hypothetical protein [Ruminococcus sp.]MDE6671220.1 hypothetical protein [Ruminococcus sp.]MDE6798481.1 hypothetical protein [Ruminococcus sp.]
MEKNSVKPVKKTKVAKSKKNTCPENFNKGMFIGFLLGFSAGAVIVAVYDYFDEKHNKISRIKRGSDADYYYNTTD